jgi:hypothetical protein
MTGTTHRYGSGDVDVYLAKMHANGDTAWTRAYGGPADEWGESVQQTSDGGYIIAGHSSPMGPAVYAAYLIRTDGNGDTLWTKAYEHSGLGKAYDVMQTSDGGYIIAGTAVSSWYDAYLVKTDANGDSLWTGLFGGSGTEEGMSVDQTSDGGYILVGRTESFGDPGEFHIYLVRTDDEGDTLWTKVLRPSDYCEGFSVEQTSDGSYIVAGSIWASDTTGHDVLLLKTEPDPCSRVDREPSVGSVLADLWAAPNPARANVLISYTLPLTSPARVDVHNPLGQEVNLLLNTNGDAGRYTISWDGTDSRGRAVAPGIYIIRVQAGGQVATRKVVLIR